MSKLLSRFLAAIVLGAGLTASASAAEAPRVALTTSMGVIVIELDAAKAPATVENFLTYTRDGFYDGTIFHRVIKDFMLQGGGFTEDLEQKPTRDPVQNEAANSLRNDRGTIAMARTRDPHSATAQFFINVIDNEFLNFKPANSRGFGYAVFGRVVEGMDVVDQIREVPTGTQRGHEDVPNEAVVIQSARVVE